MNIATLAWSARLALVITLLGGILAADVLAQHEPRREGELIVRLMPDAEIDDLISDPMLAEFGLVPIRNLVPMLNIWLVGFEEPTLAQAGIAAETILAQTRSAPAIRLAQYNHKVEHRGAIIEPLSPLETLVSNTPNDPMFGQLWGLNNTGQTGGTPGADVDALAAWEINTGGIAANGETVVVAIVDGGFHLPHPDLPFWKNENESSTPNGQDNDGNGYIDDYHGWNAYNNSGNITANPHGTHVAGTAAASGNNGIGITGVNWDAGIMPIQGSSGNEATVVAAYGYALTMRTIYNNTGGEEGAFVVATNASFGVDFGNPANFPIWCGMYDELGQVGIVSTGATMNINANVDTQGDVPTACPSEWLISVTNTTSTDQKNSGAAYGLTTIELGAPGTGILSANSNTGYGTSSGTSMATPHVTGAIALVVSAMSPARLAQYMNNPADVALEIRQSILDGTDYIGIQTVTGGRLNLRGALEEAAEYEPYLPEVGGGSTQAASFDGTSVLETEPSTRFPKGNDLSLSLWAQVEEPGVLAELSSDETLAFRLEVIDQGGDLVLKYSHKDEGGAVVSRVFNQRALTDGRHHIAITRGDEVSAVRVFIDGNRVGQPFFYSSDPIGGQEDRFFVGNNGNGNAGITAVLDEVRLFRARLLEQDLMAWMHASMTTDEIPSSLIAYYRFESDTTGFAWDFSNNGNNADIDNHGIVGSPFPIGSEATMLTSAATSSGSVGPDGASLTASVSTPLGSSTHLGIYVSDISDDVIHDETFPAGVEARINTIWGAHAVGDVTADLVIAANSLVIGDGTGTVVLYRPVPTDDWIDVSADWNFNGTTFSTSGASTFGQYAIGYTMPVSSEGHGKALNASLSAAYPNPFGSSTTLTLELPEPGQVIVEVLDVLGRRVMLLHEGNLAADVHQLTLDGSRLAPGMYLIRAVAQDFSQVQRVTLVR